MPRPPPKPTTALGAAIQQRRGTARQEDVAEELRLTGATLSRLERGANRPTYDTAVKLAAWLGWTTDQVMQAADQPAPPSDTPDQVG